MIQQRNIAACIIFSIITCGIYGLYWIVVLNDDANVVSRTENGTSGALILVLTIITCGIYGWFWLYQQGEKIDRAKNDMGMQSSNSGLLYLILGIIGLSIVSYALMQNELNNLAVQK